MNETVRVGLIGCGAIAGRHVAWFLDHPRCEIPVLCDVSEDAAAEKAAAVAEVRPGAAPDIACDYRAVLSRDDLDAVAVLLPHNLHHPVTIAALEAGKHVLVEKPMAVDSVEARDMVDAARGAGRVLAIGYQRAYLPEYVYVRNMIARGEMGTVRFITAHLEQAWCTLVRNRADKNGWKSDPVQAGGGQLMDTGSHTLAALFDVTRLTPSEVYAVVDHCEMPVDVNTSMVVRFAEGVQAAITIGGFGHSVTESIRVVGEAHSARIFFRTVKEQALEVDGQIVDAKAAIPASTPNAGFIDAILNGGTVAADGILGLRVMQLTEAAYRSAREERPVRIES